MHRFPTAWAAICGGGAMTPSGMRGVLNDAISIYFADATLASAFVAPAVRRVENRGGRRRVPSARGRAGAADRGGVAPDAVRRDLC